MDFIHLTLFTIVLASFFVFMYGLVMMSLTNNDKDKHKKATRVTIIAFVILALSFFFDGIILFRI